MSVGSHQSKVIHLATDHAGLELKDEIKDWLKGEGKEVIDHGTTQYDAEDDFPDYIKKAAKAVSSNPDSTVAIIFGGSGQGEAMVANRFPYVRATVYYGASDEILTLSRTHNDANVLSVGARFVGGEEAKRAIASWLEAVFSGEEKRVRRNQKLEQVTKAHS